MGMFSLFGKGKVLYYPGCLTKGVLKEQFENYKEIFNKLGIDFILLSDVEVCCGLPVLNSGHRKDARRLAKKNFDIFKKNGIRKIVTNCPSCYHAFKDVYPTMVRDWNLEVEHATVTVLNALKKKKIKFVGEEEEREIVAYHDPCHLGRYGGIFDEPREVIEMLGGKIIGSPRSKRESICCGAGGGVRANFPELAKAIAKKKAEFIHEDIGKIISPCGLCYANIKHGTDKSTEFSNFVLGKLGRKG
jgi:heterodisulfide reductase subunit D